MKKKFHLRIFASVRLIERLSTRPRKPFSAKEKRNYSGQKLMKIRKTDFSSVFFSRTGRLLHRFPLTASKTGNGIDVAQLTADLPLPSTGFRNGICNCVTWMAYGTRPPRIFWTACQEWHVKTVFALAFFLLIAFPLRFRLVSHRQQRFLQQQFRSTRKVIRIFGKLKDLIQKLILKKLKNYEKAVQALKYQTISSKVTKLDMTFRSHSFQPA
jgi:hypothetical protein